jgi:hypothetical protein
MKRKAKFALLITLFFALENWSVAASDPDLDAVIGQSISGKDYPAGWKWMGGELLGGCEDCMTIGVTHLQKGKKNAVVSEQMILLRSSPHAPRRYTVLDGIVINVDPADAMKWSQTCEIRGEKKLPGVDIFAEAQFKRCQRFTTKISRAWRLHVPTGKFTPIPTQGVVCEYLAFGQEPFTEDCPGVVP